MHSSSLDRCNNKLKFEFSMSHHRNCWVVLNAMQQKKFGVSAIVIAESSRMQGSKRFCTFNVVIIAETCVNLAVKVAEIVAIIGT